MYKAIFVCFGLISLSLAKNPYTINQDVSSAGSSAQEAKDMAIKTGKKDALMTLFEKLLKNKQDLDQLKNLDDHAIEGFIDSVQVSNESIGPQGYKAKISFEFHGKRIVDFLRTRSIAFNAISSKNVTMLLPLLSEGAKTFLFEQESGWLSAWKKHSFNKAILQFVLPNGDLKDLQTITAEDVVIADRDKISAIAKRYEATAILVAYLEVNPTQKEEVVPSSQQSQQQVAPTRPQIAQQGQALNQASKDPDLTFTLDFQEYDADGHQKSSKLIGIKKSWSDLKEEFMAHASEDDATRAAEQKKKKELEDQLKATSEAGAEEKKDEKNQQPDQAVPQTFDMNQAYTLLADSSIENIQKMVLKRREEREAKNVIFLRVPTKCFNDYQNYMSVLEESNLVNDLQPVEISKRFSVFRMHSTQTLEDLINYLKTKGLFFEEAPEKMSPFTNEEVQ
jgi:hypothetical protein